VARRTAHWITALALGLTLQGCFGMTELERSADVVGARKVPIIAEVNYRPPNFLDPEAVDVHITPGQPRPRFLRSGATHWSPMA
jgi:hypothetical protein